MTNDTLLSTLPVKIDGQPLPAEMAHSIEQIVVETSLHLPSVATLVLHDPALAWLDHSLLEPGKTLLVAAAEGGTIFDGEIVEVEADLGVDGQHVIVRAFDRLHRLARGTHTRAFKQVSDGDLVKTCAGDVGLSARPVGASGQFAYFIQANETNLAMLQRRAAANGYLLYADGAEICFKPPDSASALDLAWGYTLASFRPRLTSVGRVEKVTVRGWDPGAKQAVVGSAESSKLPPAVGLAPKNYFAFQAREWLADLAIQDQQEARSVAQARADTYASRFIEAEGVALGDPKLKAGSAVTISGVGTRFSGTYFVTSATHRLVPREPYVTEFSISGLNPTSILSMLAPPATDQAPLGGLTIGLVTDNKDPEHLGRVKVKYPLLIDEKTSSEIVTDWARIASWGGGNKRGLLFLPEVNDEVLIGFGHGNLNLPFVLGALWNGKDPAPGDTSKLLNGSGEVVQRVIYSRTGHYILLDDSDADGGISIVDKKGNKLVFKAQDNSLTVETAGNITVKTKGDLSVDVKGNATLKAQGNLALEAQGNLALKAQGNLTAEAMGQASVSGTSGATFESSAIVEVKGSMINLN